MHQIADICSQVCWKLQHGRLELRCRGPLLEVSTNLPVRLVLAQVKSDKRGDGAFLNIMLTCRLWCHIFTQLLWTDISSIRCKLASFHTFPIRHLPIVRSLSIKVPIYDTMNADTTALSYHENAVGRIPVRPEDIEGALELLPKSLKLMENLDSFSLVIPCLYAIPARFAPKIKRGYLLEILQVLPP